MESALPAQPLRVGVVLAGNRESSGWWGAGRPAGWQDAIEAAREVLRVSRVAYRDRGRTSTRRGTPAAAPRSTSPARTGKGSSPGTPGNCTRGWCRRSGCPDRTCAVELDLSVIGAAAAALPPAQAPVISAYPVATQDVALVVRGCGARRRGAGRAGRRGSVGRRGRRDAARGRPALRHLHRRAGRGGQQVPRLPAALPRALTARSPTRRPPPPGTPPWPRRPAESVPCCATEADRPRSPPGRSGRAAHGGLGCRLRTPARGRLPRPTGGG